MTVFLRKICMLDKFAKIERDYRKHEVEPYVTDDNDLSLTSNNIRLRFHQEEKNNPRKITDGDNFTGRCTFIPNYEPMAWVLMGGPVIFVAVFVFCILVNEGFGIVSFDYEDWVFSAVGFLVAALIVGNRLQKCLKMIAIENAMYYFQEGINASFRQMYVSNSKLPQQEFVMLLENRFEIEEQIERRIYYRNED